MKKAFFIFILWAAVMPLPLLLWGCQSSAEDGGSLLRAETAASSEAETSAAAAESQSAENRTSEEENSEMTMLEQNQAADALVRMIQEGPVTLELHDYAGFEKVGPLGQALPTSNVQTETRAGDIVLYQGDQIVLFYGSNSWSYTRLGHIQDLTGWEEALGGGDATVTFSLEG